MKSRLFYTALFSLLIVAIIIYSLGYSHGSLCGKGNLTNLFPAIYTR